MGPGEMKLVANGWEVIGFGDLPTRILPSKAEAIAYSEEVNEAQRSALKTANPYRPRPVTGARGPYDQLGDDISLALTQRSKDSGRG